MSSMTQNTESVMSLIAMLQAATPEQCADMLDALNRGFPLHSERLAAAAGADVTTPVKPAKAKKAPSAPQKAKKEKAAPAPLPEAAEGAPDASDYRVDPDSIDEEVCIGRNLKGGEDKRWKPAVYRESQCGGKRVEGSDLCSKCSKREEKAAENPAKPGDWNGRITEEPDDWVHMLGTTWAEEKGCKFLGSGHQAPPSSAASVADAAEAASENAGAEEMPVAAAPVADKAAVAAAKKAEKEAEKAAAAAAKAAAAAEKAAAKEAEKAAKAAEKAAAAAEKAAAKEAEKLAKAAAKPAAKPAPKATKAEAKKPVAEKEPVVVEGELKLIDGTLYMVKNGNVFEYDELAEKAGDFVGRLTGDETIDTEADEVTAAESDAD